MGAFLPGRCAITTSECDILDVHCGNNKCNERIKSGRCLLHDGSRIEIMRCLVEREEGRVFPLECIGCVEEALLILKKS